MVKPLANTLGTIQQSCAAKVVRSGGAYPVLARHANRTAFGEIRRLGFDFPLGTPNRSYALDFQVTRQGDACLRVIPPPYRVDIQEGPADVIEDLVRIHGYDRLPTTLLADALPEQHMDDSLLHEERIRDLLVNLGLQEVINYALTDLGRERPLGAARGEYIRLLNPIHVERGVMRQRLLPGILEALAANLRHEKQIKLFEIGPVFLPVPGEKLPVEPLRLAIALLGSRGETSWADGALPSPAPLDFFDLKGIIEALVSQLHLDAAVFVAAKTDYLHPGKSAELLLDKTSLGVFGQLHPKAAESYGLGSNPVWVAELDLEEIIKRIRARHAYVPVPDFAALRDLAILVKKYHREGGEEILAGGGDCCTGETLRLYRGDSIPPEPRVWPIRSRIGGDRTLTDKESTKPTRKSSTASNMLKGPIRGEEMANSHGRSL